MRRPQDIIHAIDVASGKPWVKATLALLAAALLLLIYNLRCYRNLATREAMDAAQLGRNLAEGRGYTTSFIRPFSMYLLARRTQEKSGKPKAGELAAYSRIQGAHPDIVNAPAYPVVLAGLMKALPFEYVISVEKEKQKPSWSRWRYQPDFLIGLFNQVLLLATVALAFLWARRLFDSTVAWISAAVLLGMELLWRFSVSGLSTLLLLLIFMGLVWCLTLLESRSREPARGGTGVVLLALATGALVGLVGLTRYAFAWLIIPVLIFLALSTDARRPIVCLLAAAGFAVVFTPWVLRNYDLSGAPFGAASYAIIEGTGVFPEDRLERSLHPEIEFLLRPIRAKLFGNLRQLVQGDLFSLGGGWITAFFLVGLMVPFRNPAVRRLRHFLLLSAGALAVAQTLGRTQLSSDSPEINSENLLVLLAPLVVVYAVSLFVLLLDQVTRLTRGFRYAAIGVFVALSCLPLLFAVLGPRTIALAYPPYHPLVIQQTAAVLKENELMMSDIPWAVAWYGRRSCVWLTLNAFQDPNDPDALENFTAFHDQQRAVSALYLTPRTLSVNFASEWRSTGGFGWGNFVADTISRRATPRDFPLREMPDGYLPEQLFVTDRRRW